MSDKILSRLILVVAIVLLGLFYGCCSEVVFAASEGGGYEGEGYQTGVDCDISWDTVYACEYGAGDTGGAAWKWYRWPEGASSVEIPGYVNESWPQVNLIGSNRYITGCGNAGGYWRYAYVAVRDSDSSHYLKYLNGSTSAFKKGDQLGLSSIGSSYSQYRAKAFGGDMYYNGSLSDRSFSEVGDIYNASKNKNPGSFTLGWNGSSSLSWFCAPDPNLSSFQGTSRVIDSRALKNDDSWNDSMVDNGTGFQFSPLWKPDSSNKNRYVYDALIIQDCDPVGGCSATFRHYLKKVGGTNGNSASTTYSITRNVNGVSEWVVGNTRYSMAGNNGVASNTVKMYPGQKVCETLWFNSERNYNEVSTGVCAVAVATKGSDISVQIRDQESGSEYKNWRNDEVYAKPGDNVELKGTYAPHYQPMYETVINGPFKVNNFVENGKSSIGQVFDANINPGWKNAFSVEVGGDCGSAISGTIGSSNTYDGVRSYIVQGGDVGEEKIKRGSALTNCNDNMKNTPNSVGLTYNGNSGFNVNVDTGSKSSEEVEIKVPYNFENSTEINDSDVSKVVYAGGNKTIKAVFKVGSKNNEKTNGRYATNVPGARWDLQVRYDGGAWETVYADSGDLNGDPNYNRDGKEISFGDGGEGVTIPIRDVAAGTEFCVRSHIFPKSSGRDENLSTNFSGDDYAELCYTVAKKPSFQVWGGSIYSAKNVNIPLATKKRLAGDYSDGTYVFGSWAELGVVAGGTVKGLASGAGLGYASGSDALVIKDRLNNPDIDLSLGGGTSNNYCDMSTLSFANIYCSSGDGKGNSSYVGGLGVSVASSEDKSALVARFSDKNDDGYELDDEHTGDYGIFKIENFSGVLVGEGEAQKNKTTKVIKVDGTAIIKGDITYKNDDYTSLKDIPKIIIYASNIKINCDVARIDAVLIADGEINDCVDESGNTPEDNARIKSKQLIINGSVTADKLELNRTYGAATGVNSIVPAEIVNYDSSLYLWAYNQTKVTESSKLTESTITELAPRF